MLLVVALSDCALRLSEVLVGASYLVKAQDPKELRHKIHQHQPDVVVLDWRIGGSSWRASDEVPAIISRTTTHPHVILVLPMTSEAVKATALTAGCYDVVSITSVGWEMDVAEGVSSARRSREARRVYPHRTDRLSLH